MYERIFAPVVEKNKQADSLIDRQPYRPPRDISTSFFNTNFSTLSQTGNSSIRNTKQSNHIQTNIYLFNHLPRAKRSVLKRILTSYMSTCFSFLSHRDKLICTLLLVCPRREKKKTRIQHFILHLNILF